MSSTNTLFDLSDNDLLQMIGERAEKTRIESEGVEVRGLGASDFKSLGRNIFNRINRELHELFCGSGAEDAKQRQDLAKIFRLDHAAVQGALTVFLISTMGLDATIAAVIAVLIIKKILIPAGAEVCLFWEKHLAI